ncbi:stage III sporulation protein AF [Chengkuizengella sediminis]|uniref:stage III sporulation protein AF n=1 Tax=Chengkuizengella sediminis TaxID=1885917 RepID=UPI001389EC38|nr:stage III sporulation protein AF [Chengkuizengella sediminis]NDI34174.1 stage III sporulation protein AF [Chengkuizengella sediminis]
MLQWLSSWLREIILVILLASFVDLILPSNKMQRYVKVVISLFILMTILSPIVSLLKVEWDFDQLNNQFQLDEVSTNDYGSMSEILQDGEKLKDQNEHETAKLIQTKMEDMIYKQLEEQMSVAVQSVSVKVSFEESNEPKVDEMVIVLQSQMKPDQTMEVTEVQPIEQVEPVVIDIHLEADDAIEVDADEEQKEITEEMKQTENEITTFLISKWDISSDQINVKYEPTMDEI